MYYIIFIIGIILSIINDKKNDKKNISLKLFALILAVLAFLRYGVGADYFAYNFLYTRLSGSLVAEFKYGLDNQEVLFRLIGSIFKGIGFSYQHYIVVIATLNLYYISKICKRYSKNPTLSLLTYFCFYYFVWTFSGLRQGLTLSIGIYYLLECLESNKTLKLIIISAILFFIHKSALTLIPLYFISKINFTKNKLISLTFLGIILSFFPIMNILMRFNWIPIIQRIVVYINPNNSLLSIFEFKSVARLIFLAIGLFYYEIYSSQDEISKKIINIYILSLISYFVFKSSELIAARISLYGFLLNILILPNIYYLYKNKIHKFIYLTCFGFLLILYFNKELHTMERQSELTNPNKVIIPYTNIYNKNKYSFTKNYLDLL